MCSLGWRNSKPGRGLKSPFPSPQYPHPPASLTEHLHPEVDPHGDGAGDEGAAHHQLPFARGRLHLGERLTEGGAVQLLDLLPGQFAPVALLLLTQNLPSTEEIRCLRAIRFKCLFQVVTC